VLLDHEAPVPGVGVVLAHVVPVEGDGFFDDLSLYGDQSGKGS
jgi:hypothetical protein